MQVILLKDVKNVGKEGQIVKVSDGYAQNFLIAKKLAVPATEKSLEIKQKQDDQKVKEYENKRLEALKLKAEIENVRVTIYAGAGKDGRMFGAVSAKQICEELKKQHHLSIDKRKFVKENSATSFGTTKLKVELFKGVIAEVTVDVKEK